MSVFSLPSRFCQSSCTPLLKIIVHCHTVCCFSFFFYCALKTFQNVGSEWNGGVAMDDTKAGYLLVWGSGKLTLHQRPFDDFLAYPTLHLSYLCTFHICTEHSTPFTRSYPFFALRFDGARSLAIKVSQLANSSSSSSSRFY